MTSSTVAFSGRPKDRASIFICGVRAPPVVGMSGVAELEAGGAPASAGAPGTGLGAGGCSALGSMLLSSALNGSSGPSKNIEGLLFGSP